MRKMYGVSRTRDRKGKIIRRNLNDYVMCIHALVGGYVQVLELNRARVCNSLTTVEKDNYVYETEDTSGNEQRVH